MFLFLAREERLGEGAEGEGRRQPSISISLFFAASRTASASGPV
jgi:hypothetical protein